MTEQYIQSKLHDFVIDIAGGDRSAGARLIAWPRKPAGAENQRWSLVDAGDGYFYIRSALHGQVVDIGGGDRSAGAPLIAWPINTPRSDNQLWSRVPAGDGYFYLKSKLHGFVIDIRGGGGPGSDLIAYPTNTPASPNQLWRLVDAGAIAPVVTPNAGSTGAQAIDLPPGKLAIVIATAQSAAPQSAVIRDAGGAAVFSASGRSSSGGSLTVIGSSAFFTGPDTRHTVELTAGAGVIAGAHKLTHGDAYLTTYVFGANDGGVEAGDRDFNDLVLTIQVFSSAG